MKKALVLSLAAVLCLGFASFAEDLWGTWDTYICFAPDPDTGIFCCPTITTDLSINYEICNWTFGSTTSVSLAGWTKQAFSVDGQLGLFTINSDVVFDPTTAAFSSWTVVTSLNFVGVDITGTFKLVPNDTSLTLVVDGSLDCVDVKGTLTFGTAADGVCDFNWTGVTFVIDFPFCCVEDIRATVIFDCTGFVSAEFCAIGIAFPNLDWVTIDICFTFTPGVTGGKDYTLTTNFDFGVEGCIDLILTDPTAIFGNIDIVGVSLECTIAGVDFTGISYWGDAEDADKPGLLAGTPYWEAYQFKTDDDGCCGTFNFGLTIYFLEDGLQLFDVAAINTFFDIEISQQFTLGMTLDLTLDPAPASAKWCLHFLVNW